ncbi:MAG: hypothetical protein ACJ71I_15955 [Nitrososphaeraceae archaeon]
MSRIESRGNQNYFDSKIGFARLFFRERICDGRSVTRKRTKCSKSVIMMTPINTASIK